MSVNQKEQKHYQELVKKFFTPENEASADYYIKTVGKTTICGKNLEIIFCDLLVSEKKSKKKESKAPNGQSLLISRKKTVRKVTNIINCNVWQWPKKNGKMYPPIFLTLTFNRDVTDLKIANRLFTESMQRYNYRLFKRKEPILQYVAVPEFMENGRVHYHCLIFNLPFSFKNYDIAKEVWGNGYVWMKSVYSKTPYHLAKYMTKYLLKACDDQRFFRKRKYFTSSNVLRPVIIKSFMASKNILEVLRKTAPRRLKNVKVEVDFVGTVDCYYFHFNDSEDITDLLLELDHYTQNVLQSEINREREKLKL
jgi:hypothetical protein